METDTQRTWSGQAEFIKGYFFGGSRRFLRATVEWKPNKHFLANVSYRQNDIKLDAGEFVSKIYSARVNVAFNQSWAWLNLVQGDNVSDTVSINSRLRYQPRADREFFLVFNQTRDRANDETLDTAVILKASINFQL